MIESSRPSLYETLYGNFTGGFDLHQVSEQNQVVLSVLDNMQRVLNCRAGTLAHLPDYGLPDMTKILQGMPGTAHELMGTLSVVLLKYEPRLKKIGVVLLEQTSPANCAMPLMLNLKVLAWCAMARSLCPKDGCCCDILSNSNISTRQPVCKAREYPLSKILLNISDHWKKPCLPLKVHTGKIC